MDPYSGWDDRKTIQTLRERKKRWTNVGQGTKPKGHFTLALFC